MNRYKSAVVAALYVYFVVTLIVFSTELSMIPAADRLVYSVGKLILIFAALPLVYWIKKNPFSIPANLSVGIVFLLYTMHGQYYRPLYYFAFFQIMFCLSFIFQLPKRVYVPYLAVSTLSFLTVFHWKFSEYLVRMQTVPTSDVDLAVLGLVLHCYICHKYFISERFLREFSDARLANVGIQTTRIIHDLKSLTGSPLIYAQLLEEKLKTSEDKIIVQALKGLSNDLKNLSTMVFELNQLSTGSAQNEPTLFHLSAAVDSVKTILGHRLEEVEVKVPNNIQFNADKELITSLILNLFLNSLDSFRRNATKSREIMITLDKKKLTFSDNGGGFPKEILVNIRNAQAPKKKPGGSGLGMLTILRTMSSLDGKARFFNQGPNAHVELSFPKKVLTSA